MAKLIIKIHGEEVGRAILEDGQEYLAGRAADAQIKLDGPKGISRHHLKFYQTEGYWVCEALSKFALIHKGTQTLEVLELTETTTFSVPPFDFVFEPDRAPENVEAPQADPQPEAPKVQAPLLLNEGTSTGSGNSKLNNDATVAGAATLIPYIRISFPNTADDEVLKLEGNVWTAGRDSDCEISIDSPHVSRKHFEVTRTDEGFFVTDLGSSNGTKLNGQTITPHEPTRLDSGDELRIMNIILSFEIRDTHFNHRLNALPQQEFNPLLAPMPEPWYPPPQQYQLPAPMDAPAPLSLKDWKQFRPHHLKQVDWKKNKVRVALIALMPFLLYGLLAPAPKKTDRNPASDSNSASFENLTTEKKAVVKDSFNLARNLYVQGKYALCLTELAKVHELIAQFENSKELQSFCEQGLELVRRQEDAERKERERLLIEQQITGYVEVCKAKLPTNATVDETRQCMAEAMILSPEHPLVLEMIHTAQMHEEEAKFLAERQEEENARAAKGRAHFKRANDLYKKGRLSASVAEFDKFINTNYPRSDSQKETARRQIASIRKELDSKVAFLVDQCKTLGGRKLYKEAYIACDKAVDEDSKNKEAIEYRDQMLANLRREMKVIYEDSVLEESLGNVESAKEKWKKIVEENLDFEEYAKKARSKLKKYEAGF